MLGSARVGVLVLLLMAARLLGPLLSLARLLPFSPARRHRGTPVMTLPDCSPVLAPSKRRSPKLMNAPAPAASWITGHSWRPTRNRAWVLRLRSRYRGLGRGRGAMSGARRATVVIPGSLPEQEPRRASCALLGVCAAGGADAIGATVATVEPGGRPRDIGPRSAPPGSISQALLYHARDDRYAAPSTQSPSARSRRTCSGSGEAPDENERVHRPRHLGQSRAARHGVRDERRAATPPRQAARAGEESRRETARRCDRR